MNCAKIAFAVLILFLTACSSATPSVPTSTATAIPLATPTMTLTPTATQTPTTAPTTTPVPTFTLSGIVFFDYNGNGVRDGSELVIPKAKVQVGNLTTISGADGNYSLPNVPKGKREITISAEGFHFVSLSLEAFQSLNRPVPLVIDGNTKSDWGLMVGFMTLPFKCEDTGKIRASYLDLDFRLGYIRTWENKPCDVGPGPNFPSQSCSARDNHQGVDWSDPEGIPILAEAPGTVVDVGERPEGYNKGGGKYVTLVHDALGRKFQTFYGHNSQNLVTRGQRVDRGQVIALSGKTGTDIPHLHSGFFEFPATILTLSEMRSYYGNKDGGLRMLDPFHQQSVPADLDPFRDLTNPASESFWTKDNSPECIQSSTISEIPDWSKPNAVVDLTDSVIRPDGKPNDWGNRSPNRTPPRTDDLRMAGADLSAFYAFADSKNLYLRLDQYHGFPLPPLQSFEYSFEITSPEWGNRWYLITIPNSGSPLRLVPIEGATFLTQEQKVYNAVAIGQVLEGIVPLEMLKNPSQVTITALAGQLSQTKPLTVYLMR